MEEWEPVFVGDFLKTPIRRLEGVTYWVIQDSEGIQDFVNTEIRKEWEADARFEGRDPSGDPWLTTLSRRDWRLEVIEIEGIKLNPDIMDYVDDVRGYNFAAELARRSDELRTSVRDYSIVIWPVIVREEDFMLMDGYCRYTALNTLKIRRTYAYLGTF